MKRFVFVNGDYWDGLYVDGRLAYQHHTIPLWKLMPLLGFTENDWEERAAYAYLEEEGSLPFDLNDVIFDD